MSFTGRVCRTFLPHQPTEIIVMQEELPRTVMYVSPLLISIYVALNLLCSGLRAFHHAEGAVLMENEGMLDVQARESAVDGWLPDLAVSEDVYDTFDEGLGKLDLQQVAPDHGPEGKVSASVMRHHGQQLEHLLLLVVKHGIENAGNLIWAAIVKM